MNWLHYLLEANIYLALFYLLYFLLLNNETHYKLNRAYLLITCAIAYVIPVIQIGALRPVEQGRQVITIILNKSFKPAAGVETYHLTLQDAILYAYIIGAVIMLGVFIFKLIHLVQLTKAKKNVLDDKYKLVKIEGSNTAFSFFNYVFIGTKVFGADTIIRHEQVHIDQKHSFDIIFLELIKIISWFNPFIYLLQRSLKTVHEYIADEHTAAYENDALAYSSFLVRNAYGISGSSITHSFFNYNLLKRRIIMLNQKRSGNLARLKYLLAVPLCAGLLCVSTLGVSKTYGWVDIAPKHELVSNHNARTANPAVNHDSTKHTSKGYKYQENGYLIKGKTNYRVIITEKNGEEKEYFKNSATAADVKLLRDKYGYKFPTMPIYAKLPPPPPMPPGNSKNINKRPPPPPPAPPKPVKPVKVTNVKLNPPPPPPSSKSVKPVKVIDVKLLHPPPPPQDPFETLYKYIAKNVRYPTNALANRIAGRMIFMFDIENFKISNVRLVRSLDPDIDAEATRVLNNFSGTLQAKSGNYSIPLAFSIQNAAGNEVGSPPKTSKSVNASTFSIAPNVNRSLNEVVIAAFVN